ncbi:MAG: S46 family peptidase [Ignavibacteriaceae bacterium]
MYKLLLKKVLFLTAFPLILLTFNIKVTAQTDNWFKPDTVKAGRFDTGRMWTFEYPPLEYFKEAYNFVPDDEWLDHVRMSALKFATYCSASFVSEDGLVMTNHHCGRMSVTQIQQEGEDLHKTGFWAESLEDERPVPGLFVDQLVLIEDVTDFIRDAIDEGSTYEEKLANEQKAIDEIEGKKEEETGLRISVVKLYNGGKYSLYGYKRYSDVRLVFAPEDQAGFFGGDPDNFTYPRYNLDCTFFRVYDENSQPLKTEHFLKWSENGAANGEPVFVVGNPASTNRLKTVSQLEYFRDISYPRTVALLKDLVNVYEKMIEENPEKAGQFQDMVFNIQNGIKSYEGRLSGLRNPVLMQKKRDFENKFKLAVKSDEDLNKLYGDAWDNIEDIRNQIRAFSDELFVLNMNRFTSSQYFFIAEDVIALAEELKLPESERSELYKGEELQYTIESLIPEDFDAEINNLLLLKQINRMEELLGADYPLLKQMTGGRSGKEAIEYILENSYLTDIDKLKELIDEGADAILSSEDPFINFMLKSTEKVEKLQKKSDELTQKEKYYEQLLGRAIFEVYGTSIPPDATFTLRISDGVVKGFPYNGTIAPPFTTFYGMYDRYYSFNKEYPWSLSERWQSPPPDFNLEVPFNFVSTNDIIGGNSGSPVVNTKGEIVGLAFDGNIESLPGDFIFDTYQNRTVSVHSEGMIEAISDLYKAKRLSEELKHGKITE